MADVDAVVIGSGAGGMAAAVALANQGKSVAVFEQHDLPGGWCHSFDLEGFRFSPGVHYLGELGPGGRFRRVLEGLGVGGDLVFHELDPDGYDRFWVDGQQLAAPRGRDRYRERMVSRFPQDAVAIDRFFHAMQALSDAIGDGSLMKKPRLAWTALRPLEKLLSTIGDPTARAMLSLQGGDHAMPPSRCPTILHAGILGHYFDGAWTPRGGGRALPKAFIRQLRRRGGTIQVKQAVERILVEDGAAIGVRLADGTEVRSHVVVSNADPAMTFGRLLPAEHVPGRLQWKLRRTTWSVSCLSLFLAADIDPASLGVNSGNVWALRGTDPEAMDRFAQLADPLSHEVPGFFLTCTTAKDPGARRDGLATFEVFSFVSWQAFARWAHEPYGARSADYEAYKEALADKVMEAVEAVLPGLSQAVVFRAVGTPLTNRHYVAAHHGALYATEKRMGQLGPMAWPARPMPGLALCGASTLSHGVSGAVASGVAAAAALSGARFTDMLSSGGPEVRTVLADHPEGWPADLKRSHGSKG